MIIDLSEIIRDSAKEILLDNSIEPENIEFMGESFVFNSPLHVVGKITNNTKALELRARAEGTMEVHCARCRRPITVPISFGISEIILRESGEEPDEEIIVAENEQIELYDIVLNNFLMNVEGRYLCSDDCKGLCQKCGKDLNTGDCGCDNDEIDPRWAGLAEIMKNSSDTK